jgi:hypothetical protein
VKKLRDLLKGNDEAYARGVTVGSAFREKVGKLLGGQREQLPSTTSSTSTPTPKPKRKAAVPSMPRVSPAVYSVALQEQLALERASTEPLIGNWFDQMYRAAMKTNPALSEPRDERDVARAFRTQVTRATPFFWTGAIADVVLAASKIIPDYTFTAESFPVHDAFVWLEHPVTLLTSDKHGPIRLTAWQWNVDPPSEKKKIHEQNAVIGGAPAPRPHSGWTCSLWGFTYTPKRPAGFPTIDAEVHFGWTLTDEAELPIRVRGPDAEHRAFLKFVAASLSFLEQELVVTPRGEAHRTARRRLERAGSVQEPYIKVVELRRRHYREHGDAGESGEGPDWKNRWIVSGHWRRQYYPSTDAHKPLYIAPYVKGPEDRPLKTPQSKLFVVKR